MVDTVVCCPDSSPGRSCYPNCEHIPLLAHQLQRALGWCLFPGFPTSHGGLTWPNLGQLWTATSVQSFSYYWLRFLLGLHHSSISPYAMRKKEILEFIQSWERRKSCHLNHMDGAGGHYAKWDKSDKERQRLFDIIYTWNLKKLNL